MRLCAKSEARFGFRALFSRDRRDREIQTRLDDRTIMPPHSQSSSSQVSRHRYRRSACSPSVSLEEDKRPDHDILPASRVGRCGRVDTGGMERPTRHRRIGYRVIALQHRNFVRLLLREPVPLVVRTVGEPRGLADAVVTDPVVGDVWLVREGTRRTARRGTARRSPSAWRG